MKTKPFKGKTTRKRRAFFDSLYKDVVNIQKVAGANVTVDPVPGKGSIISSLRAGGGLLEVGACCRDWGHGIECQLTSAVFCIRSQGIYYGDGTVCTEVNCNYLPGIGGNPPLRPPHSTGACCGSAGCSFSTEGECNGGGGNYQGNGSDCDPDPCFVEPAGACCDTAAGTCRVTTMEDCAGIYLGDGSVCDGVECEGIWGCNPGITHWCGCSEHPACSGSSASCCLNYCSDSCGCCYAFVHYCCCCHYGPFGWFCC